MASAAGLHKKQLRGIFHDIHRAPELFTGTQADKRRHHET